MAGVNGWWGEAPDEGGVDGKPGRAGRIGAGGRGLAGAVAEGKNR